ncbi:hypothetical protein L579_1472 [Pantoea sp. AS-PWVM4]|nr:hypothetical protein L579_1472 [Pantoea sp. AS-PWVM4]
MSQVTLINELEVETGGVTQLDNRRQVERNDHRIFDGTQRTHRTSGKGRHFHVGTATLVPRLEADEGDTGVLSTTGKAEAVNGKHRVHAVFLFSQEVIRHLVEHFLRTFLSRTGRQLCLSQQQPLILFRQERGRKTQEQIRHADNDDQIKYQVTTGAAYDMTNAINVVMGALIEQAVKPAEETGGFAVAAFLYGFQHGCAQRRRQNQRHQHRQGHR